MNRRNNLNSKFLNVILILFLSYTSLYSARLIPNIISSVSSVFDNRILEDSIISLMKHAEEHIPEDSTYIFLDADETGFLNFYKLRYYLAPRKSLHFNSYYYYINHASYDEMLNKLIDLDFDYLILRENLFIESEFNLNIDPNIGYIFKKNISDSKTLSELLIPIDEVNKDGNY